MEPIPGNLFFAGIARGAFSAIPAVGAPDAPVMHIGGAPFWFGTNPLLGGMARTMSVVAQSPCLVARVPQHVVAALLAENPERWRFITQLATEILNTALLVASDLLMRDSRRRCIAVLLRVAGCRTGNAVTGTAEMTQDELAAMANLSRQTIGPILRALGVLF